MTAICFMILISLFDINAYLAGHGSSGNVSAEQVNSMTQINRSRPGIVQSIRHTACSESSHALPPQVKEFKAAFGFGYKFQVLRNRCRIRIGNRYSLKLHVIDIDPVVGDFQLQIVCPRLQGDLTAAYHGVRVKALSVIQNFFADAFIIDV